jgi:hypothetical protein
MPHFGPPCSLAQRVMRMKIAISYFSDIDIEGEIGHMRLPVLLNQEGELCHREELEALSEAGSGSWPFPTISSWPFFSLGQSGLSS